MKCLKTTGLAYLWMILLGLGLQGCEGLPEAPHEELPAPDPGPPMIRVQGYGNFGSQCPFGTISELKSSPLELWGCPLGLEEVRLAEALQPLVLQVDCKKMTMDVRGNRLNHPAVAWEILPDGSFNFSVDGGNTRLVGYPSENETCIIPLSAELWGKVDCSNPDKVKINVETIWRATRFVDPTAVASPTPTPIEYPYPYLNNTLAVEGPTVVATPSPDPSVPPFGGATPLPSMTPSFPPALPTPVPSYAPGQCRIPTSCFFHTITEIKQCE